VNRVVSIAEHLERQSVRAVESTIPEGMTIQEWRRQRHQHRRPAPPQPCGHVHDTTTRYDHDRRLLTFLLVCPTCGTEKVLETQPYEPHFKPHAAPEPETGGATIHQLPVRRHDQPLRRAA
jgi:hypothetical protein